MVAHGHAGRRRGLPLSVGLRGGAAIAGAAVVAAAVFDLTRRDRSLGEVSIVLSALAVLLCAGAALAALALLERRLVRPFAAAVLAAAPVELWLLLRYAWQIELDESRDTRWALTALVVALASLVAAGFLAALRAATRPALGLWAGATAALAGVAAILVARTWGDWDSQSGDDLALRVALVLFAASTAAYVASPVADRVLSRRRPAAEPWPAPPTG
jgi:hypothetical protein